MLNATTMIVAVAVGPLAAIIKAIATVIVTMVMITAEMTRQEVKAMMEGM